MELVEKQTNQNNKQILHTYHLYSYEKQESHITDFNFHLLICI